MVSEKARKKHVEELKRVKRLEEEAEAKY